jgi:hypothetical protein
MHSKMLQAVAAVVLLSAPSVHALERDCSRTFAQDPIGPGDTYESPEFDVSAYDHYAFYMQVERVNPKLTVTIWHGTDSFYGPTFRQYTQADFISLAHDEHRLITPAELIMKTPLKLVVVSEDVADIRFFGQLCVARDGVRAAGPAQPWAAAALVAVLAGAFALRGRRRKA